MERGRTASSSLQNRRVRRDGFRDVVMTIMLPRFHDLYHGGSGLQDHPVAAVGAADGDPGELLELVPAVRTNICHADPLFASRVLATDSPTIVLSVYAPPAKTAPHFLH